MTGTPERRDWFIAFAAASGTIALLALCIPLAFGSRFGLGTVINLLLFLPAVWTLIVIVGLIEYRWRGLWLLLGAPAAFFNLIWFFATFNPCNPSGTSCL